MCVCVFVSSNPDDSGGGDLMVMVTVVLMLLLLDHSDVGGVSKFHSQAFSLIS